MSASKELIVSAFSDLVEFARWRDAEAVRCDERASAAERDGHGTTAEIWRDRAEWERKSAERLRDDAVKLLAMTMET